MSAKADFLVEDGCVFEIGGESKDEKQIAGKKKAYVVRNDIEVGYGSVNFCGCWDSSIKAKQSLVTLRSPPLRRH